MAQVNPRAQYRGFHQAIPQSSGSRLYLPIPNRIHNQPYSLLVIRVHTNTVTHARIPNKAQRQVKNAKLANCRQIPAKKIFCPASLIAGF
jgi:hypothetical protein